MWRPSSNAIRCSIAAPKKRRAGSGRRCGTGRVARTRTPRAGAARARARRVRHRVEERARYPRRGQFSRRMPRRARRAALAKVPAGYSEWAGVGAGGRDDSDYNLEAFVSAETTLADWLRDQLALAVASRAAPHDRAIPDRSGRRSRLSERRSRSSGGKARHQCRRNRSRARHLADLRSAGHMRARSCRVPGAPAQGTRPLRSGDAGADRTPRSVWPGAISRH